MKTKIVAVIMFLAVTALVVAPVFAQEETAINRGGISITPLIKLIGDRVKDMIYRYVTPIYRPIQPIEPITPSPTLPPPSNYVMKSITLAKADLANRLRVPVSDIIFSGIDRPEPGQYAVTLKRTALSSQPTLMAAGRINPQPYGTCTYIVSETGYGAGSTELVIKRVNYPDGNYDTYSYKQVASTQGTVLKISTIWQFNSEGFQTAIVSFLPYAIPIGTDPEPSDRIQHVTIFKDTGEAHAPVKYTDLYSYKLEGFTVARYKGMANPIHPAASELICTFIYKGMPNQERLVNCTFTDGTYITYQNDIAQEIWNTNVNPDSWMIKFTYRRDPITGNIMATFVRYADGPEIIHGGMVDPVDIVAMGFGDVDFNGNVTVADLTLVTNWVKGVSTPTNVQRYFADVNKDGQITALDARIIDARIKGTITDLPRKDLIYGDLNGNGYVSSADVSILRRYLAGLMTLPPERLLCADIDDNGKVDKVDVLLLRLYAVGTIRELPAAGYGFILEDTVAKLNAVMNPTEFSYDFGGANGYLVPVQFTLKDGSKVEITVNIQTREITMDPALEAVVLETRQAVASRIGMANGDIHIDGVSDLDDSAVNFLFSINAGSYAMSLHYNQYSYGPIDDPFFKFHIYGLKSFVDTATGVDHAATVFDTVVGIFNPDAEVKDKMEIVEWSIENGVELRAQVSLDPAKMASTPDTTITISVGFNGWVSVPLDLTEGAYKVRADIGDKLGVGYSETHINSLGMAWIIDDPFYKEVRYYLFSGTAGGFNFTSGYNEVEKKTVLMSLVNKETGTDLLRSAVEYMISLGYGDGREKNFTLESWEKTENDVIFVFTPLDGRPAVTVNVNIATGEPWLPKIKDPPWVVDESKEIVINDADGTADRMAIESMIQGPSKTNTPEIAGTNKEYVPLQQKN